MPPYTARILSPVWAPRSRASASIWTTSSRVGAMMSTRGEAGADDADLVEDAQGARHEGLIDHVGSGSEDGRDDEVDEDGVLPVPREELRGDHADEAQDGDDHGQLEDHPEGEGELDHEVRVGRHGEHRLPALLLP